MIIKSVSEHLLESRLMVEICMNCHFDVGGMNEARISFVRRAFDKVDMEKGGIVNYMNLKKFANPSLSDDMELFQVRVLSDMMLFQVRDLLFQDVVRHL